jgi:multidrug resistance efflux pump
MLKKVKFQVLYQMKKIISNTFILLTVISLFSCGSAEEKQADERADSAMIVKEVIGIGKILPEKGIVELAAEYPGMVEQVFFKAGDSVKKGDLLFNLKEGQSKLELAEAEAQRATKNAQNKADEFDIKVAEIKLEELRAKYNTSKSLALKGAETKEMVDADYSAYIQQKEMVEKSRQLAEANKSSLNELNTRVKLAKLGLTDRQYRAPESGVLLNFDIKVGQNLSPNSTFGELAPLGDLKVEAEVDELYADEVSTGMRVLVYPVGKNNQLTEGKISYVSASLQNKSILYESIGEGVDRRVRRIEVSLPQSDNLLINAKVECRIILR